MRIFNNKCLVWLLATTLSLSVWLALWNLEKSGEIEGPLFYVNGVLWMALFFAIPFSFAVFALIPQKITTNHLMIKVSIGGLCFAISFVILAVGFFLLSQPVIDLLDSLFPSVP